MNDLYGDPLNDPPRQLTIGELVMEQRDALEKARPSLIEQVKNLPVTKWINSLTPEQLAAELETFKQEQEAAKQPRKVGWPPPWHKPDATDRRIARQYKDDSTPRMF